ncbi:MAG TPA: hypothetical protein VFD21_21995 [Vicinamibacterales bacterium]|nr:hypothetical protein [Vicinamibacterales bacterium]
MKFRNLAFIASIVSLLVVPSPTFAQAKDKSLATHNEAATALKQDMRKLWTDHVVWTRDYIVAATLNQPDAPAALNRLMKNQDDIGNAMAKFYGAAAGRQLTTLLKDHIAIAGDIVKAAMGGDKAGQKAADDKWHQNAIQISDFLSKANPNWPRATLLEMMNTHLSTTAAELGARLSKDWEGDVKAFDAVYDHILHMADALSDGIIKQFPEKFGGGVASTTGR